MGTLLAVWVVWVGGRFDWFGHTGRGRSYDGWMDGWMDDLLRRKEFFMGWWKIWGFCVIDVL